MDVADLQEGEFYALGSRRCRLEKAWVDADGQGHARVSLGRSFERTEEIHAPTWSFGKTNIQEIRYTWEDYKAAKKKAQEDAQRAVNLSSRLRGSLEVRGLSGWVDSSGRIHIHGDLDKLDSLVCELEKSGRQLAGPGALDELFGR